MHSFGSHTQKNLKIGVGLTPEKSMKLIALSRGRNLTGQHFYGMGKGGSSSSCVRLGRSIGFGS
jgi:hypothetical protein